METIGVSDVQQREHISFSAKIEPVEKLNDEFLKCRVSVCALGKNRNKSHISKEAADDAEYSLAYTPVVGHLYEDEDGNLHMGGHDLTVKKDQSGKYVFKSLCVPYGVVPKEGDVRYEEVTEPNGEVKTYITSDCILWIGRYPELLEAAYSKDALFNQSMEINIFKREPLKEDESYVDIQKYTYSALCLLGKSDDEDYNVEPCFPESKVSAVYEADAEGKFASLFAEMKKNLSECFSKKYCGKEEGTDMENEKPCEELAANEQENVIPEETAETPAEPECAECAVDAGAQPGEAESEPVAEEAAQDEHASAEPEEQAQEAREFTYREISKALEEVMPNGENVFYWVMDFDTSYAYVVKCEYEENNYSEEHGRFGYVFDENNKTATLVGTFEKMYVYWLTQEEKDSIESMRKEYSALKEYKEAREAQDKESAYSNALGEFEDLAGIAEFEAVVENKNSYGSVEELKKECYAIRGQYGIVPKSKTRVNEPSVGVKNADKELTPREKMHAQYGKR